MGLRVEPNIVLLDPAVTEALVYKIYGITETDHIHSNRAFVTESEINAVEKRVDLDSRLRGG